MSAATLNVLGFCRSTVGGYDVWTSGDSALMRRRNVAGTTINRMNYQAVYDCLVHVLASIDAPQQLELRIGCYSVVGQLTGCIPARLAHVRDMCGRITDLVRECAPRTEVRFQYAPDLDPPRCLVGHCRPPSDGRQIGGRANLLQDHTEPV